MTIKEIKRIAREHGVGETHIRGTTKSDLLRNIDSWYNSPYQHSIIRNFDSKDDASIIKWKTKRDALRKALNYE